MPNNAKSQYDAASRICLMTECHSGHIPPPGETQIGSVVFELNNYDHERVVFCRDRVRGLRCRYPGHLLGPALGGCRMYPYQSEREALVDVLIIPRNDVKASVRLNLGGGKSVIIGDPRKDKSKILWRAMSRLSVMPTSP